MAHQYISNMVNSDTQPPSHRTRRIEGYIDSDLDPNPRPLSAYQHEIEELRHIKASVNNELRDLENRRLKLQAEISSYSTNIDNMKLQHIALSKEVGQVKLALEQIKFEQEESRSYVPSIRAPHRIISEIDPSDQLLMPSSSQSCQMENCFDFSRCSLVSGFPVYVYNPMEYFIKGSPIGESTISDFLEYFSQSVYRTTVASKACVFIVLMGEFKEQNSPDPRDVENFISHLPHWGGDGRNHVLLNLASSTQGRDIFQGVNTGRAMLVQSAFTSTGFRHKFDVLIPPNLGPVKPDNVWQELPMMSPLRRKYLLSYWGQFVSPEKSYQSGVNIRDYDSDGSEKGKEQGFVNNMVVPQRKPLAAIRTPSPVLSSHSLYSHVEQAIVSSLKSFQSSSQSNIFVDFSCGQYSFIPSTPADWALCGTESARMERIFQSTFTLIISPLNMSIDSTTAFQTRVYEALRHGSVPVILGSHGQLPFSEVVRWNTAAIFLPTPRVTEVYFYLQSFPDEGISALRIQGRLFFQTYFSSTHSILDMLLAVIRTRLQIPAKPVPEEPSPSVFPSSFIPLRYEGPDPEPESDEVLGPIESPFPSETYRHNFSHAHLVDSFNNPGDPFGLYPFMPFEPWLPSEAKFKGNYF